MGLNVGFLGVFPIGIFFFLTIEDKLNKLADGLFFISANNIFYFRFRAKRRTLRF